MKIYTYDYESNELTPVATISRKTALAVGAQWSNYSQWFLAGYNLYAIEGGKAVLLETYESRKEAEQVRRQLVSNMRSGGALGIV